MNEIIRLFYIAGGVGNMMKVEFIRGLAWSCGALIIYCVACAGTLIAYLFIRRFFDRDGRE